MFADFDQNNAAGKARSYSFTTFFPAPEFLSRNLCVTSFIISPAVHVAQNPL